MAKFLLLMLIIATVNFVVGSHFAQCTDNEICKPFIDCEELRKTVDKGYWTPSEKTYLRSKQCNFKNRKVYVCCTTISPMDLLKRLPSPPVCGSPEQMTKRIVGGEATEIDEFPWFALIQYRKPRNEIGSVCGGSLISDRYVLTAAHCDRKVPIKWQLFQVRLGEWDKRTNPDCQEYTNDKICNQPHVEILVEEIIIHEDYNPDSRSQPNDIALLRLQKKVEFTDFISPICLPLEQNSRTHNYTGQNLLVTGFGKTENKTGSYVKLKVPLEVMPQNECKNTYAKLIVDISGKQMCAGGEVDHDSCQGDSGGPMMKIGMFPNYHLPYYMLVGLVSFGARNCSTKNFPGIYTRTSEYVDWIAANMK